MLHFQWREALHLTNSSGKWHGKDIKNNDHPPIKLFMQTQIIGTFWRPPLYRRYPHRSSDECEGPSLERWWMSERFSWKWLAASPKFAKLRQASPKFAWRRANASGIPRNLPENRKLHKRNTFTIKNPRNLGKRDCIRQEHACPKGLSIIIGILNAPDINSRWLHSFFGKDAPPPPPPKGKSFWNFPVLSQRTSSLNFFRARFFQQPHGKEEHLRDGLYFLFPIQRWVLTLERPKRLQLQIAAFSDDIANRYFHRRFRSKTTEWHPITLFWDRKFPESQYCLPSKQPKPKSEKSSCL